MALPAAGIVFATVLGAITVRLVVSVMVALGISVTTFVGVGFAIEAVETRIFDTYGNLPPTVIAMLNIGQVPYAIRIILAAIGARYSLLGLRKFTARLEGEGSGAGA